MSLHILTDHIDCISFSSLGISTTILSPLKFDLLFQPVNKLFYEVQKGIIALKGCSGVVAEWLRRPPHKWEVEGSNHAGSELTWPVG